MKVSVKELKQLVREAVAEQQRATQQSLNEQALRNMIRKLVLESLEEIHSEDLDEDAAPGQLTASTQTSHRPHPATHSSGRGGKIPQHSSMRLPDGTIQTHPGIAQAPAVNQASATAGRAPFQGKRRSR